MDRIRRSEPAPEALALGGTPGAAAAHPARDAGRELDAGRINCLLPREHRRPRPPDGLSIGKPATLFQKSDFYAIPFAEIRQYDVAPDGKGFVMIRLPDTQAPASVPVLVTNWFAELERKLRGAAGR
jgi:hypothetical protein